MNKISFINDLKNEGNKKNLFKSFNFQKTNINTEENNNNKKDDRSYIVLSYSKKDKINKVNKTNTKYNKSIKNKSKLNQTEMKESENKTPFKIININSHRNTFLDISTNYEPNMDSRNSSIERSISFKKKDLRNFSCSPSHENKKKKEISNIKKGQIVNLTKKNNMNFNTISEGDELKEKEKEKRKNTSKEKKKKKVQICHNKVTINLSINYNNINNINDKDNKKVKSKLKKNCN